MYLGRHRSAVVGSVVHVLNSGLLYVLRWSVVAVRRVSGEPHWRGAGRLVVCSELLGLVESVRA